MSEERWLPVVGWEGLYEVSDQGRVRTIKTGHTRKGCYASNGRVNFYYKVGLSREGTVWQVAVHTLVLTAFTGPRPEGKEAAHKDGNTKHNTLFNLEWKTASANSRDRILHGTQQHRNMWHKITPQNASDIRAAVAAGATQKSQCEKYRLSNGYVCQIVNRTGKYGIGSKRIGGRYWYGAPA